MQGHGTMRVRQSERNGTEISSFPNDRRVYELHDWALDDLLE
jgi:hypothetical protein